MKNKYIFIKYKKYNLVIETNFTVKNIEYELIFNHILLWQTKHTTVIFNIIAVSAFIPSAFGSPKNVDRQNDITNKQTNKPSTAQCRRGFSFI